ncbi:MFS transporter [Tessaracoccus caeni]|uniref:MFS transporter n=1 Tax=Tessaracoccus caeni TaxID=3031239 RepID=UPI0023DB4E33|nr:MFS transporter [Tessaracoccus caeni]MDF1487292.1 MFS transporter [Tessaracoccus caeni]
MSETIGQERAIKARNGLFAAFAINGFAFATWMSRIPDVKDALNVTPGQLSLLLLSISVGALTSLPLAGRICNKIGAKNTVRLGMAFFVPGVLWAAAAVTFSTSLYLAIPGLFLVGLGNGSWDVAQNVEGTIVERGVGRAIMPWFHAAFSGGTVLGALIGAGIVALRVPIITHIAVVAVIVVAVTIWGTSTFLSQSGEPVDGAHDEGAGSRGQGSAWLEPRTLLIGLMVLAAAFAEGTANDWMAVAFVDGHGVDNAMGVVGLAVFLAFMTLGRILGTQLLDNYGRVIVLRIMFGLSLIGCLMVVYGNTWLAFIGAAIWGVGASLGFPVGMSAAADDPARAPLRISVVSTIGYGAFLGGPPLLGFLGDHIGVLNALLAVGAISVVALFVVPAAKEPELPAL